MELLELEYFMITCEKGSFNQAAECRYQPNESDQFLEKELDASSAAAGGSPHYSP